MKGMEGKARAGKTKKNPAGKPAKKCARKPSGAFPPSAWDKLKGHGPFPQVALDENFKKEN